MQLHPGYWIGVELGGLWPSVLPTGGKETGAAVVAQRDANLHSGGCFYGYVGSEQRKGAKGMKRRQEQVLEGNSVCAYAWAEARGCSLTGGPSRDQKALIPGQCSFDRVGFAFCQR